MGPNLKINDKTPGRNMSYYISISFDNEEHIVSQRADKTEFIMNMG